MRCSSSSSKPRRRSPSFARTHSSSCARRSSSSTRPPGAVTRAASATARAGSRRGAAPATAARRPRDASFIGSFSSSPFFQMTFDTRRRRASAWRASSTDLGSIDGDDARRPARGFDGQVAFAAAQVGDLHRRQQQAERARPGGPAAARHQLPRVARVRAGVRVEVLLPQPQHFLQPRLVGPHRGIAGRRLELRAAGPPVSGPSPPGSAAAR